MGVSASTCAPCGSRRYTNSASESELRLLKRLGQRDSSTSYYLKALQVLNGKTIWHVSARNGMTQILRRLGARNGVRVPASGLEFVNAPDRKGRTPLQLACKFGHQQAVSLLLELGADIYAKDKSGQTVLHYLSTGSAADQETTAHHLECLSLIMLKDEQLRPAQAQPVRAPKLIDIQDDAGVTALHISAAHGDLDMTQSLLDIGAELCLFTRRPINKKPIIAPARTTALHLAAAIGNVQVAKAIVQAYIHRPQDVRKPDPRLLMDMDAHQPYMVAGNAGHWICAQMLLLISRDDTHVYWQDYMQLGRPVEPKPLPTLAQLAQKVWTQHLSDQVTELEEQYDAHKAIPGGDAERAASLKRCISTRSSCTPEDVSAAHEAAVQRQARVSRTYTASMRLSLSMNDCKASVGPCDSPTANLPWAVDVAPEAEAVLQQLHDDGHDLTSPLQERCDALASALNVQIAESGDANSPSPACASSSQVDNGASGSQHQQRVPACLSAFDGPSRMSRGFSDAGGSTSSVPLRLSIPGAMPDCILPLPPTQHISNTATRHSSQQLDDNTCQLCFERPATLRVVLCKHGTCPGCAKRVIAMEAKRPGAAPKCAFCQQFILAFDIAPL